MSRPGLPRSRSGPSRSALILASILALSVFFRVWGVWHGLPWSYYPDEAHFVKRALSFGSGDLNPHWFHKPALYMYIVFFEYGLYFVAGKLLGLWAGATDFAVQYVVNPGGFYWIGRLTSVAFSVATVWVAYRIGERHLAPGAGVWGGILLALTAGTIAPAQYVKEDIPSMFFATLALYALLTFTASGRRRDLLLACVAGGASAATKAYGMIFLALIPVAAVFAIRGASRSERLRRAASWSALGGVVFIAAQFALAPFSFLDPLGRQDTFGRIAALFLRVGDVLHLTPPQPAPDEFLGRKMGIVQGFLSYAGVVVSPIGAGWVIAGFGIVGAGLLAVRRRAVDVLLLLYLTLFVMISVVVFPGYAEPRHQTPIYPVLAACGGYAIVWIPRRARWPRLAYAASAALLLVPLAHVSAQAIERSREDTRNAAKRWIESNIPPGTRLVLDENGPQLLTSERELRRLAERARQADPEGQFTAHYATYLDLQIRAARRATTYDLQEIRKAWWRESEPAPGLTYLETAYDRDMGNPLRPVGVASYDEYLSGGYEYAVVSSERYDTFWPGSPASQAWPSFAAFYADLSRRGALVREFSAAGGRLRGPTIRVYRLTAEPDARAN